jgi:hypothetical protein
MVPAIRLWRTRTLLRRASMTWPQWTTPPKAVAPAPQHEIAERALVCSREAMSYVNRLMHLAVPCSCFDNTCLTDKVISVDARAAPATATRNNA